MRDWRTSKNIKKTKIKKKLRQKVTLTLALNLEALFLILEELAAPNPRGTVPDPRSTVILRALLLILQVANASQHLHS